DTARPSLAYQGVLAKGFTGRATLCGAALAVEKAHSRLPQSVFAVKSSMDEPALHRFIDPDRQARAFRRDDNKIQWRPEGGDLYFAQSRPIIVEFSEEVATRPHLLARDASVQEREQSAVIGCRNGDEAIDPRTASKHLN